MSHGCGCGCGRARAQVVSGGFALALPRRLAPSRHSLQLALAQLYRDRDGAARQALACAAFLAARVGPIAIGPALARHSLQLAVVRFYRARACAVCVAARDCAVALGSRLRIQEALRLLGIPCISRLRGCVGLVLARSSSQLALGCSGLALARPRGLSFARFAWQRAVARFYWVCACAAHGAHARSAFRAVRVCTVVVRSRLNGPGGSRLRGLHCSLCLRGCFGRALARPRGLVFARPSVQLAPARL